MQDLWVVLPMVCTVFTAIPSILCALIFLRLNRDAHLMAEQQDFNSLMSSVRESVEWGFGDVVRLFGFVDYLPN